ncbi:MAG TPA: tetratricopeptide repeat protein [Pyrinomonadaceae bacterium]|nr:tetratricopeptide repeat protein [Pyrinomonadaceae bacterium]
MSSGKTAPRPKPLAKRSGAEKAPVRKATKDDTVAASNAKSTKKSARPVAATAKGKPAPRPKTAAGGAKARPATAAKSKTVAKSSAASAKTPAKTPARPATKGTTATQAKNAKRTAAPASHASTATTKKQPARTPATKPSTRPTTPPAPPRQPTLDEAAALRAFERAHKEFVRGHFSEARQLFRALIEQHSGVAEVTARARTYLAIAEARLRSESAMPRNAEELYDRGVIELNRGDFVAAQEMFERALKRDAAAAHIHYGLAATRSRLGAVESALQSLGRALELQPNLRVRAQHDPDLVPLRNEPEYERLLFPSRS